MIPRIETVPPQPLVIQCQTTHCWGPDGDAPARGCMYGVLFALLAFWLPLLVVLQLVRWVA